MHVLDHVHGLHVARILCGSAGQRKRSRPIIIAHLQQVIGDLYAGLAVDRCKLDHHVESFTLLRRVGGLDIVIRQVRPDAERRFVPSVPWQWKA